MRVQKLGKFVFFPIFVLKSSCTPYLNESLQSVTADKQTIRALEIKFLGYQKKD